MENLTFNDLPNAVSQLFIKLESIEKLLNNLNTPEKEPEKFLNVKEAGKYLNLAIPTIYGLTQRNKIPFKKRGKMLYFLESELREWIVSSKKENL